MEKIRQRFITMI